MRRPLTMEVIFPIKDEPSARLMTLKAECLHMAGVISEHEEQAVLGRAGQGSGGIRLHTGREPE
jgi:hypothetical protein